MILMDLITLHKLNSELYIEDLLDFTNEITFIHSIIRHFIYYFGPQTFMK